MRVPNITSVTVLIAPKSKNFPQRRKGAKRRQWDCRFLCGFAPLRENMFLKLHHYRHPRRNNSRRALSGRDRLTEN
jgi:hypothetical protein